MDELLVFATVVEQSSLNKASQLLNLSQPALSRKISKLEDQLGIELFERIGRRLELTRLGRICYDYAVQIRELQQRMQLEIQTYKAAGTGKITIGASLTTLQSTLPELITLFRDHYPETEIKAVTGKTHEIVSLVKEKKVDVGLIAAVINQSDLVCEPLFDDHLCLVLPRTHDYVRRKELSLTDLNGLPLILFSKGTWYRILTDELFLRYRITPDVHMEIDSFEAITRLVSTCHTATLLPQSYVRQDVLTNNGLVMRQIEELEQTARTTSIIYGDYASLNETARQLIAKAREYYQT
ncbi:LysR family transcriptional regulator [Paenibacillus swuensis]|uniref:LysR family transcriptional regulator n=1 Tax=Paenibacillus swuensis TaxID=1178515 RepID=A0A172TH07_9BACL|nr:LysR family transcriptional regulator [Paenibacillus swuensis]ANE46147.1 LysR family transcriptional regulator [Paenibacillus swuensis]